MPSSPSGANRALWAVLLTTFQTPFMGSALNLAIPAIGSELQAGAVELSWVMTAYLLTTAAVLLPMGRLGDGVGRRRLFWWGVFSMVFTSLACAVAPTVELLISLRALQGVSSAMAFSTGMAILSVTFPASQRGRVFGLAASATYLGLSLGPVVGGFIAAQLGWRYLFILPNVLSVVAAIVVLSWRHPETAVQRPFRFDWIGALLYTAGLPLVLFGLSNLVTGIAYVPVMLFGLLLFAGFLMWQRRTPSPLLDLRTLGGNSAFLFSSLAALIQYAATFALGFLVSLQLQVGRGMGPQRAGVVLLAQPAVMALFSPVAGALSDRLQPRILASAGMGLSAAGLLAFVMMDATSPLWIVMAALALVGLGFALFSSPNSNAVMSSVTPPLFGLASSMLSTMRVVGQSTSMALTTLLLAAFVGNHPLDPSVAEPLAAATRLAFLVFSALCALGVAASLARGNLKRSS